MWTRRELKEQAKATLKKNYWKAVLVGVLIMFVGDALNMYMVTGNLFSLSGVEWSAIQGQESKLNAFSTLLTSLEDSAISLGGLIVPLSEALMWEEARAGNLLMITLVCLLSLLVLGLMQCFLINPFAVLCRGFFVNSFEKEIGVGESFQITGKKYWNYIKAMFIRDAKISLWSCLPAGLLVVAIFIRRPVPLALLLVLLSIPATILLYVKIYECMLVPYILADNPKMGTKEALLESKRLMQGEKWKLFVLQFSFIGWTALSMLTFDILAILFVTPYQCYTYAAWYREISPNKEYVDADMLPEDFAIKVLDNSELDDL